MFGLFVACSGGGARDDWLTELACSTCPCTHPRHSRTSKVRPSSLSLYFPLFSPSFFHEGSLKMRALSLSPDSTGGEPLLLSPPTFLSPPLRHPRIVLNADSSEAKAMMRSWIESEDGAKVWWEDIGLLGEEETK